MAADSPMFGGQGTIDPNDTMNNVDFGSFFDNLTPMVAPTAGNTPGTWVMDQFLDYPNYNTASGFPFPQQNPPFGIGPQATNSFTAMNPGNIMALQQANGQQVPAQTANPSTLMDNSNTGNTGYSTRQATGSTQTKSTGDTEASPEAPAKKPRKQRKKRSKQMSEAEANEKRQKFLDRNKVAAHKCRQRKKEWTDNLQTKSQMYQLTNDMLRQQVTEGLAEIAHLKMMVSGIHTAPRPLHTCAPQEYAKMEHKWQKFLADEKIQFAETAQRHLAAKRAARNDDTFEFSEQAGEDMSRRTSMQSHQSHQSHRSNRSNHSIQSSGFGPSGGSERNDSGVEVNTPEDAIKSLGTPKNLNIDEGIDLGNGQNLYGHMMPNPRVNGPIDLNDPMVYINNMAH
jgi:hypothetical protein